jgi:hypothetical protein
MIAAPVAVLVCATILCTAVPRNTGLAGGACSVSVVSAVPLTGRIDELAAASPRGAVIAEVGIPGSSIRFLPRDSLMVVDMSGMGQMRRLQTGRYLTAPGLVGSANGDQLYAVVDSTLFTIGGADGRLVRRQGLPLQAVGWPAAVSTGIDGSLFVIGQAPGSEAAQIYSFSQLSDFSMRARWSAALGLTHAGIWVGGAGGRTVAVYLPDQHDSSGIMSLLDSSTGAQRASYQVPMPPSGSNTALDRLYLAGAGHVQARTLGSGKLVAVVEGDQPFASSTQGTVAFTRSGRIVVADGKSLQPLATAAFPGGLPPTAMAWQGPDILIGNEHGVVRLSLRECG